MMQSTFSRFARTATRSTFVASPPATSFIFSNVRWLSSSADSLADKIAFIGTGKMAQAMLRPLINKGYQPQEKIAIYDVHTPSIKAMKKEFEDIQTAETIAELVEDADIIVCAVKPQNINDKFWSQFPEKMRDDATFVSILAGIPIREFEPSGIKKIVRAMPNTPAQIGQGMTVWSCTPNLTVGERESVRKVLNTFGKSIYVDDEKFVDMSTSISGSGPAYIFMLMEAMIDAGVHMGFSREVATKLCHQTIMGSTMYAIETGEHPAILRNMVTSPAGTTASAIYELENGKFRVVIKDAIWACYRRSLEMGGKESDVGPGRSHTSEDPVAKQIIHHHYPSGEMTGDTDVDTDSDDESPRKSSA
ncbi:unnamed protein product [Cylindrotheca closterium]|uniref:Pyrroline-5-carboxylate reductase n=1 Tax=Cylindrotheca closterium TaxID=2856 RepID=A0AAD2G3J9_9STRA|nr:unnamed protein product [Cylindrotheca closterium]